MAQLMTTEECDSESSTVVPSVTSEQPEQLKLNSTKRKAQDALEDVQQQDGTVNTTKTTTNDQGSSSEAVIMSKQDKGKAKKRRKEEQRAMVHSERISDMTSRQLKLMINALATYRRTHLRSHSIQEVSKVAE